MEVVGTKEVKSKGRFFKKTREPCPVYLAQHNNLSGFSHAKKGGNSVSLDEAEQSSFSNRRFMPAPRRARSAERFDGMRINSGDKMRAIGDEVERSNFYTSSPHGQLGTVLNRGSGVEQGRRLTPSGLSSPPPPYTAAISEKSCPPSYRQAIAASTPGIKGGAGHPLKSAYSSTLNNGRNNVLQRGAMSFDEFGTSGTFMRSAISVPTFTNDTSNTICSCSKCQIQQSKPHEIGYGDYNDSAVYMESQAFLMHEIMTDGMAFCSIM